jgi:hypothetical protein
MVRPWCAAVKDLVGGVLHGHQVRALALFSWAVAVAGHCHSGRVAAAVPGPACPASRRRRFERLLANANVRVAAAADALAAAVLGAWAGRPIILILDETCRPLRRPPGGRGPAQGRKLCCMKVSVGYRRRAVPLAFACYRTGCGGGDRPRSLPRLVLGLLRRVAAAVPPGSPVTLLADRGLCWPAVVDECGRLGWHYVLRLQGQTAVRWAEGAGPTAVRRQRHAADPAPRRGCPPWRGTGVEVFRAAGWRRANVLAVWERRCRGPWLLVTDLPASYARCRGYAKRCWCEQMHRDEKSGGFRWDASRVDDPARAERLLLVMALAMLLAIGTGGVVLKRGWRRLIEGRGGRRRRLLSVVQLGLRWLRDCLTSGRPPPPPALHLYPP